jgi:hypothetical protein
MPGDERLIRAPAGTARVESCWMCGMRSPVSHMVPDGGSACADVRWYCQDMRGCMERWTAARSRLSGLRPDGADPLSSRGTSLSSRGGSLPSRGRRVGGHEAGQAPAATAGRLAPRGTADPLGPPLTPRAPAGQVPWGPA